MRSDTSFMTRCEELARSAALAGESPVGAVIVRDNQIISEAKEASRSKKDVTCHAEIEAIRLAVSSLNSSDLSQCILYTTHEPCVMCSYAIRFYKIRKVVYQQSVQYLGGIGSPMPLLTTTEVPTHWGNAPEVVKLADQQHKKME